MNAVADFEKRALVKIGLWNRTFDFAHSAHILPPDVGFLIHANTWRDYKLATRNSAAAWSDDTLFDRPVFTTYDIRVDEIKLVIV